MYSAILLCAGQSRRMGTSKALLTVDGCTLVERALKTLKSVAAITDIVCVTGADRLAVERAIGEPRRVWNEHYRQGIFTSIQAGVRAVNPSSRAFFVTLVDLPGLIPADYEALLNLHRQTGATLVRSHYHGRPAHPVLIGQAWASEILAEPAARDEKGLAYLFKKFPEAAAWFEADSDRGSRDLDTPEEYDAYVAR